LEFSNSFAQPVASFKVQPSMEISRSLPRNAHAIEIKSEARADNFGSKINPMLCVCVVKDGMHPSDVSVVEIAIDENNLHETFFEAHQHPDRRQWAHHMEPLFK